MARRPPRSAGCPPAMDQRAHDLIDRIYAQQMGEHRQVGIVSCASVAEYDGDGILKHEKTRPDKENDRVRHMETLSAQTGTVFLTHRDSDGRFQIAFSSHP